MVLPNKQHYIGSYQNRAVTKPSYKQYISNIYLSSNVTSEGVSYYQYNNQQMMYFNSHGVPMAISNHENPTSQVNQSSPEIQNSEIKNSEITSDVYNRFHENPTDYSQTSGYQIQVPAISSLSAAMTSDLEVPKNKI